MQTPTTCKRACFVFFFLLFIKVVQRSHTDFEILGSFEKTHDDIKAFPLGLSIVSGDATTRTVPAAGPGQHLDPSKGPVNSARWCCSRLNNDYDPPNWHPDSDGSMSGMGDPNDLGMGVGFPDQDCDGYASPLRADIHFPSCYNPKAGLTNYKENMAFPSDSNSYLDCPKGWIHVPHLFMEVYWNTLVFEGRWEPGKGDQPFVLSSGDATGYSSHADFMSGWDTELLQHIIDTCNTGTKGMDHCPGLFYGLNEGECTIPSPVDENVDGVLDALPGNNPITGWKYGAGGKISTSNAGSDSGSGSNSGSDSESSSSSSYEDSDSTLPAATPSASQQYVDDASESSTTSSLVSTESQTAKVVAVSLEAKGVSANVTGPASRYSPSKPTELPSTLAYGHTRPFCSPKTHTVWETVTVTASEVAAQSTETNLRRHVHGHARRKFGHHH